MSIQQQDAVISSAAEASDQIIEEDGKLNIVIHGKEGSDFDVKLKDLKDAKLKGRDTWRPRIQRVPFILLETMSNLSYEKFFEPKVFAFGPMHHRNHKLQHGETLKIRIASYFVDANRIDTESLLRKIRLETETLKMCYAPDVTENYGDDELAWMFFIDGCAILHLIVSLVIDFADPCSFSSLNKQFPPGYKRLKNLNIRRDQVECAEQDILLFENQLPYELLDMVISSVPGDKDQEMIRTSIKDLIDRSLPLLWKIETVDHVRKPIHLLDLLRKIIVADRDSKREYLEESDEYWQYEWMAEYCRSASELKASGIQLKTTKEHSLTIYFDWYFFFFRSLKLPPVVIDDSTPQIFINLIAFEMIPDFFNDFEFTTYICLLSSLITEANDVKELRKANIVVNNLRSDEQVVKFFNEMSTEQLLSNPALYQEVMMKISVHTRSPWSLFGTWMSQARRVYFSSPWTFFALMGAIVLFALTFIQTWVSVRPFRSTK